MPVKLNSSGGGSVTIDVPSTASGYTLIAPAVSANLLTSSSQSIPKVALPTGSILQVIQVVSTTTASYSNASTWNNMNSFLEASITPLSSSNKIFISMTLGKVHNINGVSLRLSRNSSALFYGDSVGSRIQIQTASVSGFNGDTNHSDGVVMQYIDSPNTTSSITYSFQAYSESSSATVFNRSLTDNDSNLQYHGRAASTLILMEISA